MKVGASPRRTFQSRLIFPSLLIELNFEFRLANVADYRQVAGLRTALHQKSTAR
jgi:hypothetical protein